MSRLTTNYSIGFNKKDCDFLKPVGLDVQANESIQAAMRRESGRLVLTDGKISKFDRSLGNTLGDILGYSLEELFIDNHSSKIKLHQLQTLGKVDVRLMDGQGAIFWARLSRSDDLIHVEDIDLEKNFEMASEDLIESHERGESLSSFYDGQMFQ